MTFDLVLQVQFVASMFATLFCSVPMIINNDFQGRCSAIGVVLASTLLVILSLQFKIAIAKAATFTVGDTSGWTFNIQSWTDGKKFKAGDSLIQQAFSVIFLQELSHAGKGMALAMYLWGFASYLYGEYQIN
ncbi:hypothetical protein POTOM_011085 [Populus tomentosa]|uniref:Uncharacterized protein n=1 Tax=Populus tomentosa TaxID=118781 RepID=A0A8X8AE78_POPTO|nr:hypothetical protein POTOM_011085 [Populus tomentosa]